jgi:hypothetical protein
MAQGSFHDCCMPHRVDAAARPNLYPDWPETPEDASILVNHTARLLDHVYLGASAYCFMDPRPSIRSVRRPSRVLFLFLYAAPPILPDGSLAKHASDHFPLPSRSRPFSFCISKHFWGGARAFLRWMMRSATVFRNRRLCGALDPGPGRVSVCRLGRVVLKIDDAVRLGCAVLIIGASRGSSPHRSSLLSCAKNACTPLRKRGSELLPARFHCR